MEIEHKLRFLEQHIPKKCSKITLIGHSIGCYMILAVLEILAGTRSRRRFTYLSAPINETCTVNKRKDLLRRVEKCYFLFPTIERMKETPNGKRLWPVLNYLQWVAVIIISVLSWLPHPLKIHIASVVLGSKSTNSLMLNAVVELFTGKMFGNMMHLAHDELSNVNQLNSNSIDLMKDKLVIYYGASDKWCPLSYRSDLLKIIPDIETYIDTNNIDHAFVLSHSSTMSSVLVQIMSS